jgi:hypothetical protein
MPQMPPLEAVVDSKDREQVLGTPQCWVRITNNNSSSNSKWAQETLTTSAEVPMQ